MDIFVALVVVLVCAIVLAVVKPQHSVRRLVVPEWRLEGMRVIGISGKKRAGKDTVAEIVRNCQQETTAVAFADPLKLVCKHVFGFTDAQLYGDLKETIDPFWGFTPRYAMQQIGTECFRRHFADNIWVAATQKRILELSRMENPPAMVIVTDIRFPNEADAVRDWGGELWRVERDVSNDNHASETALDNYQHFDVHFDNNGTLDELKHAVWKHLDVLK